MKKGLEEFCDTQKTCTIKNTVCTDRNTCECKQNYIAQNDSLCKPGLNAECEKTEDCSFDHSDCKVEVLDETSTIKKCKCKKDFVGIGNICLEQGNVNILVCFIITFLNF